jgi:hypothetical protein
MEHVMFAFCKRVRTKIEIKLFIWTKVQKKFLEELKMKVGIFREIKNIFNSKFYYKHFISVPTSFRHAPIISI